MIESPSVFYSFEVGNNRFCLRIFSKVLQEVDCVKVGLVSATNGFAEGNTVARDRQGQEIGKKAALGDNTHRTALFAGYLEEGQPRRRAIDADAVRPDDTGTAFTSNTSHLLLQLFPLLSHLSETRCGNHNCLHPF